MHLNISTVCCDPTEVLLESATDKRFSPFAGALRGPASDIFQCDRSNITPFIPIISTVFTVFKPTSGNLFNLLFSSSSSSSSSYLIHCSSFLSFLSILQQMITSHITVSS